VEKWFLRSLEDEKTSVQPSQSQGSFLDPWIFDLCVLKLFEVLNSFVDLPCEMHSSQLYDIELGVGEFRVVVREEEAHGSEREY